MEIWKEMIRSDGVKNELGFLKSSSEEDDIPFDTVEALKNIEDVQRTKYLEIVDDYKGLDGEWCWRTITLPASVDPRTLEQLGVYWAIREDAAEAHWGKHSKHSLICTYEALIELKNVDWTGTMFARMEYTGGDDEQEIRFLKNATLLVRKVDVGGKTYFINNRRRA